MLQGFAQLTEQPHVLDSDNRMGGEVLQQFDLLVGERLDVLRRIRNAPIGFPSRSNGVASVVLCPYCFA
jgi:hypothetical protein